MNGGAIALQTVGLDLSVARETLRGELNAFQVDADLILQRLAFGDYPRVIHNAGMMEHIFGEMYLYLKATPHNSAARRAMSFPPSAACKFLDLPPVNLRNLHLHLTKNPFAGRPPHLCGVALKK